VEGVLSAIDLTAYLKGMLLLADSNALIYRARRLQRQLRQIGSVTDRLGLQYRLL
jgi:hypothetical protein